MCMYRYVSALRLPLNIHHTSEYYMLFIDVKLCIFQFLILQTCTMYTVHGTRYTVHGTRYTVSLQQQASKIK